MILSKEFYLVQALLVLLFIHLPFGSLTGFLSGLLSRKILTLPPKKIWLDILLGVTGFVAGDMLTWFTPIVWRETTLEGGTMMSETIPVLYPYRFLFAPIFSFVIVLIFRLLQARSIQRRAVREAARNTTAHNTQNNAAQVTSHER